MRAQYLSGGLTPHATSGAPPCCVPILIPYLCADSFLFSFAVSRSTSRHGFVAAFVFVPGSSKFVYKAASFKTEALSFCLNQVSCKRTCWDLQFEAARSRSQILETRKIVYYTVVRNDACTIS